MLEIISFYLRRSTSNSPERRVISYSITGYSYAFYLESDQLHIPKRKKDSAASIVHGNHFKAFYVDVGYYSYYLRIVLMDFDTIIASIRMKGYCYLTLCFDERLILEHDVEEFI